MITEVDYQNSLGSKVAWMKRTGILSHPPLRMGGRSGTGQCPGCVAGGIQDAGWRFEIERGDRDREGRSGLCLYLYLFVLCLPNSRVSYGLQLWLDAVDKNWERFYEAEMYRLKGELTLQQFKVQNANVLIPSTQRPKSRADTAVGG